jgi:hypothetical protein
MLEHTPDIPLWVQLPGLAQEGMIEQFAPGMPGLVRDDGSIYIDSRSDDFHAETISRRWNTPTGCLPRVLRSTMRPRGVFPCCAISSAAARLRRLRSRARSPVP